MRLTEQRFERGVTIVLLFGGVLYIARMLSYPSGAGVVPAIIGTVLVVAAGVQLVMSVRRGRATDAGSDQPSTTQAVPAAPATGQTASTPSAEEDHGLESESYATLLGLRGSRRRRFLLISAFAFLFYVGVLLVGFVITASVLIFGLMLASRERLWASVVGGITAAGAAYLFTYAVRIAVLGGILFQ